MLTEENFLYDLTVQLETQSILSACIFYRLKELINMNVQFDDFEHVPRCFSHLGKNGCRMTYAELAKHFFVDKKRIEYAMKPLKELGFIGMEYVNVQMGRHQFIFIEKNADGLTELSFKQTRSCNKNVVKQTKCFNCAAVYSHVLYWNQKNRETLIQSMRLISDYIGITKDKVKLSILKLSNFNLVHSITSTDSRYSLCIVDSGIQKGIMGSPKKSKKSEKIGYRVSQNSVPPSIDSYLRYPLNLGNGEEKSPPDFCKKNEERKTVMKDGFVEISTVDHDELLSKYGEDRVFWAITKYNQAAEEAGIALAGKTKAHLLRFLGYALENEQKRKEERMRKEEEEKKANNTYPEPSEFMKRFTEKSRTPETFEEEKQEKREEERLQLKVNKEVVEPKKVNIEHLRALEEESKARDNEKWNKFVESLSEEELGGYKP